MVHPHDLYSDLEPWTIRIKKIAIEFILKGHHVKLIHFPIRKRYDDPEFIGEKIKVIPLERRVGPHILLRNIGFLLKLISWCDVVHFQKCFYYSSLPVLIAALFKDKPVHYDWDDWETKIFYYSNPHQGIIGEFVNIFEKLIPKIVDTVSVSSRYLFDISVARGVRPENIFFAPVGADLEQFNSKSEKKINVKSIYDVKGDMVLYSGQLHGGQYVELLINAAKIVVENNPDIVFMIVGDGYRMKELQNLVCRLGLIRNFIFTGIVEHGRIQDYIIDADICVACFEDNEITRCKSPLKVVEYLACGKAVVASNVGEIKKMVGGLGVLTQPGNSDSLAWGINLLINDKQLRQRLARYSRERVLKRYNWPTTAENILSAYKKSIQKRKSNQKTE